ncbi:hypothetical protein AB0L65_56735 [Nonomuraea sp. NPDC052116]|uniref:hypothetical protein n=1 Tax=Nonomuraea sp. NPDC052116 TaxID=3155665 RepID=UPI003447DC92
MALLAGIGVCAVAEESFRSALLAMTTHDSGVFAAAMLLWSLCCPAVVAFVVIAKATDRPQPLASPK